MHVKLYNLDHSPYATRVRMQIYKKGLDLEVLGPVTVRQDRSVLKSVLANLLDNAVKYTDPGNTIFVTARSVQDRGLEFSVTNPGPALSGRDLKRLFDPFFRLAGQNAPGSGLGLTIAKKQVTRCRGTIAARNTDRGLRLWVTLP